MPTHKTKTAAQILAQGTRLNKALYHMSGEQANERYKRVAAATNRYLSNIAKRQGYKGMVDQFRSTNNLSKSPAYQKAYTMASYANSPG